MSCIRFRRTLWGGTIGETENKNIKIGKKDKEKTFLNFKNS